MGRGGKRPGAGRPHGSRNRRTDEQTAAIQASGLTPLDYLLKIMRDEKEDRAVRLQAATQAAPYVHAKLASVTHKGDEEQPVQLILNGSALDG